MGIARKRIFSINKFEARFRANKDLAEGCDGKKRQRNVEEKYRQQKWKADTQFHNLRPRSSSSYTVR